MKYTNQSSAHDTLGVFSVGALAFSVSFGVALVSISTLLIVLSAILVLTKELYFERDKLLSRGAVLRRVTTSWTICVGLVWIMLSSSWSIGTISQVAWELVRSFRLLIILLILFLINTPQQALKILDIWAVGQIFVILSSYWLWLGFPAPWATYSFAMLTFTPYTSSLDQPIMSSIGFALIWFFRDHFSRSWARFFKISSRYGGLYLVYLVLSLIFINVGFLMIGRSGMLSLIIVLTIIAWSLFNKKFRIFVFLIPFIFFFFLYFLSPKFSGRINEIPNQVSEYNSGRIESSQAIRLEFWRRSIQAIQEKPILGYGVGGWPNAYLEALKSEEGIQADSPHQQFLLWWVEEGTIGLFSLIAIYFGIFKDAFKLVAPSNYSLLSVISVLFFTSLMNCPLQGAGLGEFFCLIIGILMVFRAKSILDS
jgi:O-antigen ligase